MKGRSPTFTQLPLDIVGSTRFGRYPKISQEQTWNMIISDGFLVDAAGYAIVAEVLNDGQGRGIYTSVSWGKMVIVISNTVYSVGTDLSVTEIGTIATYEGDVYIDGNNANQIAICDLQNIYIYNFLTGGDLVKAGATGAGTALGFIPGYISFQNGRFLTAALGTDAWRLSALNDGTTWPNDSMHVGSLQTKPDTVVAVQRFPGRGNLAYVFGKTIIEPWQDIGAPLFPYQKNSSVNIDYGCLNAATIAYNENMIAWLAANEKSGPFIAFSTGGDINKISTDGIDFKFSQLTNPSNSYGFFFRQDGHLIYQITFPDDNLTYIYDFNTKKFFSLCDQNQNFHIAKRVAFFNNAYYFVSFIDGNLYGYSTQYTTFDGYEIPRIRVCRNVRMPDASRFAINNLTFTLEQGTQPNVFEGSDLLAEDGSILMTESGEDLLVSSGFQVIIEEPLEDELGNDLLCEDGSDLLATVISDNPEPVPQTVALSVSKNGGESFGTYWRKELNSRGFYKNRLIFWNLGAANDFVPQLRFYGLGRFVVTDGILSVYQ